MRRKASVETIQFILLIAICVIGFLFIFYLFIGAYTEACKRAQMEELGKIWRELKYVESMGKSVGGNIIPLEVKSCVSSISYDKDKEEIIIRWTDGSEERIPSEEVEWLLSEPLSPGTYEVKVSFKRVEFFQKEKKS